MYRETLSKICEHVSICLKFNRAQLKKKEKKKSENCKLKEK